MTINKLMSGVAAAALLTGAAAAQEVAVDGAGANFAENTTIAAEFTGALAGDLVLDFDFDTTDDGDNNTAADTIGAFSSLGAGGEVTITIDLVNAEFTSPVTDDLTNMTKAECEFTVTGGGGAAGQQVVLTSSSANLFQCFNDPSGADPDVEDEADSEDSLTLPIEVQTPGSDVSVTVTFARVSGSTNYNPPAASDFDLITYESAFAHSFTVNPAGNTDLLVDNSDSIGFAAGLADEGFLGTLTTATASGADIDNNGTTATYAAMLDGAQEVVFEFEDVTGIDGIDVTNGTGTCGAPDAVTNTVTCSIPEADIGDVPVSPEFRVELETAVAVATLPNLIDFALNYSLAASYSEQDIDTNDFGALESDDGLGEEVVPVAFDWVRIGDGGTQSNFRAIFAGDAADITRVIVNCAAESGTVAGLDDLAIELSPGTDPASNYRQEGNAVLFNSQALGAASGLVGNCDVDEIEFQYNEGGSITAGEAGGADVNRLLINRSQYGVSDL